MTLARALSLFVPMFALCSVAACSASDVSPDDAGTRPPDAGVNADSGTGQNGMDAGTGTDAGNMDSGTPADAGEQDAGSTTQLVVSVGGGTQHTCAVVQAGSVYCWGGNDFGQAGQPFGDAGVDTVVAPTQVPGVEDAVSVAAGANHTCVRHASGSVSCWGMNAFGQLGDGTLDSRGTPEPVQSLADAIGLSGGVYHSCAQNAAGEALCWGNRSGDPMFARDTAPLKVEGLTHPVVTLSSGGEFSCASLSTGNVACWGVNSDGQLGDGTMDSRPAAATVNNLAQVNQVAAGADHACAVTLGNVWCWGANFSGALGIGGMGGKETDPVQVSGISDASLIAAGFRRTCVVRTDATLTCWGYNPTTTQGDATPVAVDGLSDVVQVAVSMGGHVCAIAANGTGTAGLYCWGSNDKGQVQTGLDPIVAAPTQIFIP